MIARVRTLNEWHGAFGHADARVIDKMANDQAVNSLEIGTAVPLSCRVCPMGKGTRASHTIESSMTATTVGDIVDMDLIDPMACESLGGRYDAS